MGQVQFGEFTDIDGLALKYDFVAGEDWQVSSGKVSGVGQHGFKGEGDISRRLVWNLPFEVTYRSLSPFGWP